MAALRVVGDTIVVCAEGLSERYYGQKWVHLVINLLLLNPCIDLHCVLSLVEEYLGD